MRPDDVVLETRAVTRRYPVRNGLRRSGDEVHAVDGVDIAVAAGEILGVVGESGCGKSTLARMLALLDRPTSGEVLLEGMPTSALPERGLRRLRRDVQMVFQDPYTSLNPRQPVGSIVGEPLAIHSDLVPRRRRRDRVHELLELVGLSADYAGRYPHEFSGGQRQRIGIARALALDPKVVVCDEAVSALDVSIQAQVINLICDLKDRLGVSFVFVSHDLGMVRHLADRVAVMYLGRICETGTAEEVMRTPAHPYTAALLSASPSYEDADPGARIMLQGEPPTPIDPPHGCRFHPRCWQAASVCESEEPVLGTAVRQPGVACHFPLTPASASASASASEQVTDG